MRIEQKIRENGDWKVVRYIPPSKLGWPDDDHLEGEEEYGNREDNT